MPAAPDDVVLDERSDAAPSPAAPRHVVVDGSNLATEGRSLPSLAQLDEAVRAYRAERPDEEIIVVVDASFGYRIDESERAIFEEAEEAGEIVSPPAGAIGRGDKFLLQIADRIDAVVLSNDSFQEFHGEYGWLFDEGRLMGGKPVPAVGWIFTARTPVRGPRSRVAVREAQRKRKPRSEPVRAAIAEATVEAVLPQREKSSSRRRSRRRSGSGPTEPINAPLPFITFIADHPLGSEVEGEVESFTSHGAFVVAGGARCYAPVSGLGEPPPRSAKEVVHRGEVRTFVVQALDAPRRGIELALPGLARIAGAPTAETVEAEIDVGSRPARRRRSAAADATAADVTVGRADDTPATDEAAGPVPAPPRSRRARKAAAKVAEPVVDAITAPDAADAPTPVKAVRRAPAKRAAAKKAPPPVVDAITAPDAADASKTAAAAGEVTKITPARRAAARKAPARKAPAPVLDAITELDAVTASKTTEAVKAANKAPAKKAAARKAPAAVVDAISAPDAANASTTGKAAKASTTTKAAKATKAAKKAPAKRTARRDSAPTTSPG